MYGQVSRLLHFPDIKKKVVIYLIVFFTQNHHQAKLHNKSKKQSCVCMLFLQLHLHV